MLHHEVITTVTTSKAMPTTDNVPRRFSQHTVHIVLKIVLELCRRLFRLDLDELLGETVLVAAFSLSSSSEARCQVRSGLRRLSSSRPPCQ